MWGSIADWAACDICNGLILGSNWTLLAARAARLTCPGFDDRPLQDKVVVMQVIYKLHQQFAANRTAFTPTPIVRTPTPNESNSDATI